METSMLHFSKLFQSKSCDLSSYNDYQTFHLAMSNDDKIYLTVVQGWNKKTNDSK